MRSPLRPFDAFRRYGVGSGWTLSGILARIFGEDDQGGYWSYRLPVIIFEDSDATTPCRSRWRGRGAARYLHGIPAITPCSRATVANKALSPRQTPETGILWADANTNTSKLTATFAESHWAQNAPSCGQLAGRCGDPGESDGHDHV
jgi:hypothetical protein